MNKATLKHTLAAIIGALAVVGPQLLNLLGDMKSPKAALIASTVGFIVALCINGKAVALLNAFLPDPPQQGALPGTVQPGGPTPVTAPATPNAIAKDRDTIGVPIGRAP